MSYDVLTCVKSWRDLRIEKRIGMFYKKNNSNAHRMIIPVCCRIFHQGSNSVDMSRRLMAKTKALSGCGFVMVSLMSQVVPAAQPTDSQTITVRVTIPPSIQATVNSVSLSQAGSGQHSLCITGRDAGLYRVMAQGEGKANRFAIRSGVQDIPFQVSFRPSANSSFQQLEAGKYSQIQRAATSGSACETGVLSYVQVDFPKVYQQQAHYTNSGLRLIISAE